jgi:hypothetical protein
MTKLNKTLLLLAFALACMGAFAQQTAFTFQVQAQTGSSVAGYAFTPQTRVDGIALSDSGAIAFAAYRDSAGEGQDEAAVLTKDRVVVREGQTVDGGKTIVRIATAVVGINASNQVAYEAIYHEGDPRKLKAAIFVEGRVATAFTPSPTGSPSGFLLADDGKVYLEDGKIPPNPRRPWISPSLDRDVQRLALDAILQHVPGVDRRISRDGETAVHQGIRDLFTKKPSDKTLTAASSQPQHCSAPAFPLPAEWALLTSSGGPVESQIFEESKPNRSFQSPYSGRIEAPIRAIEYAKNCKPLVITIASPPPGKGFEVWGPSGLLTYRKTDGSFELPGFNQSVVSGSFVESDVAFQINRRGEIALKISLKDGMAVLLATPVIARP